jgi:LPXTG-motif cell wall-anchored protein
VGTVDLVHTYVADGEYRVVVTVCDSSCTDVTFLTVVTAGAPVATVPPTPPTPTASPSDRLPETGSSSRPTLQLSLALLGLGVCLVLVTRRRRTTG